MSETIIDDIKANDFIMALEKADYDLLTIKDYAEKHDVPIIRDETKNMLKMLIDIKKPKRILELGTAIAYSTYIIYSESKNELEKLVTIESNNERIIKAKENIRKFLDEKKVHLVESDIAKYLQDIKGETFDFVFLDAAKAQYIVWLPYIKKIMEKGAILLSDNIFKDGEILESKYYILKRDRTIHKRMREFLWTITHDESLDTRIFNIGDGISVSIKK